MRRILWQHISLHPTWRTLYLRCSTVVDGRQRTLGYSLVLRLLRGDRADRTCSESDAIAFVYTESVTLIAYSSAETTFAATHALTHTHAAHAHTQPPLPALSACVLRPSRMATRANCRFSPALLRTGVAPM